MHLHELVERLAEAVQSSQGEHRCDDTAHVHVYDQSGRLVGEARDAYALHGVFVIEVQR